MTTTDQFRKAEREAERARWNRLAPYVIGSILPIPMLMLAGILIQMLREERMGDLALPITWITAMATGLVCSFQTCRYAPSGVLRLSGACLFVVYLLGTWALGILNR